MPKDIEYRKLNALYTKAGFYTKFYNFLRFYTCPFKIITQFVPSDGDIVELGCGTGFFLNYLGMNYPDRKLYGFDWNRSKVEAAKSSIYGSWNITFEQCDIGDRNFIIPSAKCILLLDVLYYLSHNRKKDVLKKCYDSLRPDGVLVIKDMEKTFSPKFIWGFFQDFLVIKIFHLQHTDGLNFGSRAEYCLLLEESGFCVDVFDISKGYFYPHILYVAKKD